MLIFIYSTSFCQVVLHRRKGEVVVFIPNVYL